MKNSYKNFLSALPCLIIAGLVSILCLTGGCDKQEAADVSDPHAGHDHANQNHAKQQDQNSTTKAHRHDQPGETCFMCDPEKRESGRLWCRGHNRYEDRCWPCHPELEDKDRPFCEVHFLYKDECHLCNKELASATDDSNETDDHAHDHVDSPSANLFCNEHGVKEIECGICQPQLAAGLQPGESLKVRLPSENSAAKAGLETDKPKPITTSQRIQTYCETRYNQNTFAQITPLVNGVIQQVFYDIGSEVKSGEVLVVLHSAHAAAVKSEYLSARVDYQIKDQTCQREKKLFEENIGAQEDYQQAQAACRMAELTSRNLRQKLLNTGFTSEEIDLIERNEDASAIVKIRAPFTGTLVEREAVIGETVDPGDSLFKLADLSTLWLRLSIPADQMTEIKIGRQVLATFPELADRTFSGTINWVSSAIDTRSRMIHARATLSEQLEGLKVGMFGQATILNPTEQPAHLVPQDALQHYEKNSFVFVQQESDLFSLQRVTTGSLANNDIEILAGLSTADQVVTEGAAVLMSEFLKSRLGAGCAHD